MLKKENFSEEHIRRLQDMSHRDPGLLERTVYAFGLLEALAKVGLRFTFKGGTSLMLLLPSPMRLSTDIDIIVAPGTEIDEYIEKARIIFPFIDAGEQEREKKGNIEKRHFKFNYDSCVNSNDQMYILLDVLFEENHYEACVEKEIRNALLLTEGENLAVTVPTIDCMLGDKLTAFAPHTTGIRFGKKNLEIMKQFYDISTLADCFTDLDCVRKTFYSVSRTEIGYRQIDCTPEDVLLDIISSAVCIGSRGRYGEEDFPNYLEGTRKVTNHIFNAGFSMEQASKMAPQIIYLASCLLTDTPFERISDPGPFKNDILTQPDIRMLKTIKKANPVGFGYLVKADRLLASYRTHSKT
ncbi:MAG: nucleotidyl transferase AbiEii/AbiGii toxin family protein [Eubacteriaceae bacterium]|nr:nucleotidyl transferase AbiEii/AbiGii toxin family protein [Eubacteriaceae bacterium]